MANFGEEHRKLRLKNTDITLRVFAKKLKVSPAYVSNVENDLEPPFSEELLKRSAQLMHLPPHEEARLFALRKEGAKRSTVEKLAYQVARRAQHFSQSDFDEMIHRAKQLIHGQKGRDEAE